MIRQPPKSTPFPYPTLFRSAELSSARLHLLAQFFKPQPFILGGRQIGLRLGERRGRTVESHAIADRKSTRLNSSHSQISYAVFCLKKKNTTPAHDHLHSYAR